MVKQSDVIFGVLEQTQIEFANLEFHVRQCVHDNRCEIRRSVSCAVYVLEQESTPT